MWGLDLSGSLSGAGGVGGLLAVRGTNTWFAASDGHGNVTALINATNGVMDAQYEYGPFGELLTADSLTVDGLALFNPFRFSTKYQDSESDLVYYGARFYNPSVGRWINRDPIEEEGGIGLYGFVHNSAINGYDADGYREEFEDNRFLNAPGILGGQKGTIVIHNGRIIGGTFINQAERAYINYQWTKNPRDLETLNRLIEQSRGTLTYGNVVASVEDPVASSQFLLGFGVGSIGFGNLRLFKAPQPALVPNRVTRIDSFCTVKSSKLSYDEFRSVRWNFTERMPKNEFNRVFKGTASKGITNPEIKYVEIGGERYIVYGNNRMRAAMQFGKTSALKFEKVELPYGGFRNENDVLISASESMLGN